jgi:hypothetical protein
MELVLMRAMRVRMPPISLYTIVPIQLKICRDDCSGNVFKVLGVAFQSIGHEQSSQDFLFSSVLQLPKCWELCKRLPYFTFSRRSH